MSTVRTPLPQILSYSSCGSFVTPGSRKSMSATMSASQSTSHSSAWSTPELRKHSRSGSRSSVDVFCEELSRRLSSIKETSNHSLRRDKRCRCGVSFSGHTSAYKEKLLTTHRRRPRKPEDDDMTDELLTSSVCNICIPADLPGMSTRRPWSIFPSFGDTSAHDIHASHVQETLQNSQRPGSAPFWAGKASTYVRITASPNQERSASDSNDFSPFFLPSGESSFERSYAEGLRFFLKDSWGFNQSMPTRLPPTTSLSPRTRSKSLAKPCKNEKRREAMQTGESSAMIAVDIDEGGIEQFDPDTEPMFSLPIDETSFTTSPMKEPRMLFVTRRPSVYQSPALSPILETAEITGQKNRFVPKTNSRKDSAISGC